MDGKSCKLGFHRISADLLEVFSACWKRMAKTQELQTMQMEWVVNSLGNRTSDGSLAWHTDDSNSVTWCSQWYVERTRD